MSVGTYALCTLASAKDYLGSVPKRNGIWLYASGPSAATAEVTDTTLVLISTIATVHRAITTNVATIGTSAAHGFKVGTSVVITGMSHADYNGTFTVTVVSDSTHFKFALTHADEAEATDTGGTCVGTTTLTFADAANDTITELVGVINTAIVGHAWKSGAICNGAASSGDLIVTGALDCYTSANEITLKIEDNYNVEKLIDRATDLIERYCNRKLVSRAYNRQFYLGNGRDRLILDQYPVTRIFRLSAGETNAFTVTCTGATTFASVEVTATKIKLNKDGTVTEVAIASPNTTLTLLIAAINATAATTGMAATLLNSDYGSRAPYYPAVDWTVSLPTYAPEILLMPAAYCKSPNIAYVKIPFEDITDYRLDTVGADEDRDPGMIWMSGGFIGGEYYWIDYIAGYTTTIPAALEEACLLLVKYAWDKLKQDSTKSGESMGDYSYQSLSYSMMTFKYALPPDILFALNSFRKYSL